MSDYIHQLIEKGENQTLDFKFEISDSRKVAISLSAFSNTDGGKLLIGVKDNGKINGIISDEDFYMIQAAALMYCKPKICFITKQHQIDKKVILEIIINKGNKKPYYALDKNGRWLAYRRVNDENKQADTVQLNVWKKENQKTGILFKYTEKEKVVFEHLRTYNSISFDDYCRITHFPRKVAVDKLTNLVLMEIIRLDYSQAQIVYTLNKNFDFNHLKTGENISN